LAGKSDLTISPRKGQGRESLTTGGVNRRTPSDRILSVKRSPFYSILEIAKNYKDVIYLNIGEPDFATPRHIVEAGKKALEEGYTHYAGDRGDSELRAAISERLKSDIDVSYDSGTEVLVTAGVQAALFSAVMATINPGDEVIVFNPHYPPYVVDVKLAGGIPVFVETKSEKGFIPEAARVEEKITDRTKGIIMCSPNNPSGAVYSPECIDGVASLAKSHNLLVFSDEVYSRIVYAGARHYSIASLPGMKDRTFVMNGASKPYAMTGWRVGYLAGPEEFVAQILKTHHSVNIAANSVAQRAFLEALRGPQDCVREFVKEFDRRRRFMAGALNSIQGVDCNLPEGAFYLFPSVSDLGQTSQELAEFFVREARVVATPGIGFGVEGRIRFSYAANLQSIEVAMKRIRKAVTRLPRRGGRSIVSS